ncbi:MAG: nucleotide exchange factor GrpE [Sandaracinaceae bacterium]|nr:nucleotide exchange factor GrpE [Sandaracinaceae bacterium]
MPESQEKDPSKANGQSEIPPEEAPPSAEENAPPSAEEASSAAQASPGEEDPLLRLKAVEEERAQLREQLLRVAADFDNFRKRSRKDIEEAERRGKESVLRELLPVFDNLERAINAAQQLEEAASKEAASLIEGVKMVLRLFYDQAGRLGLERVPTVGERFDPAIHEALQQLESEEHPPGTIVQEITPGYRFEGRLLRAAMVVVARRPTAQA